MKQENSEIGKKVLTDGLDPSRILKKSLIGFFLINLKAKVSVRDQAIFYTHQSIFSFEKMDAFATQKKQIKIQPMFFQGGNQGKIQVS